MSYKTDLSRVLPCTMCEVSFRSSIPLVSRPILGYVMHPLLPLILIVLILTSPQIHTQGQVSLSLVFDRWSIVPGDPLDKDTTTRPLEPATAQQLARDFVLKTRRRKGLAEDVTISKFLEPELFRSLKESGVLDG